MPFGPAAVPVICILGTRIGIIVGRLGIGSRGIGTFAIMGQPTIDEWAAYLSSSQISLRFFR
jgi:hydrogenase maturation factor HypE